MDRSTPRRRLEEWAADNGLVLVQASNRGRRVWALQSAPHRPGMHRYTLTGGLTCYDWGTTLDELCETVGADTTRPDRPTREQPGINLKLDAETLRRFDALASEHGGRPSALRWLMDRPG